MVATSHIGDQTIQSEMKEKVLLAYSGGLDTSCILKWLLEKGYEVICFMADVGQVEDFEAARAKALNIGASEVVVEDIKTDFVENYIWPSIQMGLIYEERYLMGTSLARPCITVAMIKVAKERKVRYISHGATGKGNDQVRFELSAYALHPTIQVIAPWRLEEFCAQFDGRQALIEYAKKNKIPVSATPKSPWSMDANIMHISFESGILENPETIPPPNLYQMTKCPTTAPREPYLLTIEFKNGLTVKLDDCETKRSYTVPFEILTFLNEIGGRYGVGRIDIIENRFVGLKSRGIYETPGATILFTAHQDLEIYCMDRECYRLKTILRNKMADYVYNGLWFSPEAKYARRCLQMSQECVNGRVVIEINAGTVRPVARTSTNQNGMLYNQELVSMDVHGNYTSSNASGFIAINAVRIKEYHRAYGSYLEN